MPNWISLNVHNATFPLHPCCLLHVLIFQHVTAFSRSAAFKLLVMVVYKLSLTTTWYNMESAVGQNVLVVKTLQLNCPHQIFIRLALSSPPLLNPSLFPGQPWTTQSLFNNKFTTGIAERPSTWRAKPPPTSHSGSSPQVLNTGPLWPRGC